MCIREYSSIGILSGFLSPQEFAAVGLAVIDLVVAGKIYTPVEKVVPFKDAPVAFSEIDKGETPGKIIIKVAD
jgi:NADPH-dependent curcumin reductase CurA